MAAQQESLNDIVDNDSIDVYQLDWQPVRLMTSGQENSENLLKKICQTIGMNAKYVPYFALYLVERFVRDDIVTNFRMIRRLQNFESPLLTLRTMMNKAADNHNKFVIIIRKSYFDIQFDQDLFDDAIALNCIYLQAVHDIENGHIICNNADTLKRLNHLKMNANKLEV